MGKAPVGQIAQNLPAATLDLWDLGSGLSWALSAVLRRAGCSYPEAWLVMVQEAEQPGMGWEHSALPPASST